MVERTYLPRKVGFEALIKTLAAEHGVMKSGLARVRDAAYRGDYDAVGSALRGLEPIFRQHIVDEESQVLRLLIGELGVEGAKEEIRVFQQHRPIYRLMQRIAALASEPNQELQNEQAELEELFAEHAAVEEDQVFPKVMKCHVVARINNEEAHDR